MKNAILGLLAILTPPVMLWAPVVVATRLGKPSTAIGLGYYAFWWIVILTPLSVMGLVVFRRPLLILVFGVLLALPVTIWEAVMVVNGVD